MPRTYVNDETCNPVIDIHTHLSSRAQSVNGAGIGEKTKFRATPETVLPAMDKKNSLGW
jgi:hypothetical protein